MNFWTLSCLSGRPDNFMLFMFIKFTINLHKIMEFYSTEANLSRSDVRLEVINTCYLFIAGSYFHIEDWSYINRQMLHNKGYIGHRHANFANSSSLSNSSFHWSSSEVRLQFQTFLKYIFWSSNSNSCVEIKVELGFNFFQVNQVTFCIKE